MNSSTPTAASGLVLRREQPSRFWAVCWYFKALTTLLSPAGVEYNQRMWWALGILLAFVVFDLLVARFGFDSRPGFNSNPEPKDRSHKAI